MKKSDQKKRDRQVKNEGKQKKHQGRIQSSLNRRQMKQQHFYDKMTSRIRSEATAELADKRIDEQLEHNLKILEALEQEYNQEQEIKKKLNLDLEEQGFSTLEEKVEHLQKLALEQHEKNEYNASIGGTADVTLEVN